MNRVERVSFTRYDAAGKKLAVSFDSGRTFVFDNVPAAIAVEMRGANDQSRFFNERIRGKYPWIES